jgi:hypothetical protein
MREQVRSFSDDSSSSSYITMLYSATEMLPTRALGRKNAADMKRHHHHP